MLRAVDTRSGTWPRHWISAEVGLRNSDETMRRKESISNNARLSLDRRWIPVVAVMLELQIIMRRFATNRSFCA